jgi:hypothetical protein
MTIIYDLQTTSPETIVSELTYISYATQRDQGMTPEQCRRLWPTTGGAMEERYKKEILEASN